jgi:dsRNA-specific ribonuclease
MTSNDEKLNSKPLADVFEALAGAVFLEAGYARVSHVFLKVLGPYVSDLVNSLLINHPVKKLESIFGDGLKCM